MKLNGLLEAVDSTLNEFDNDTPTSLKLIHIPPEPIYNSSTSPSESCRDLLVKSNSIQPLRYHHFRDIPKYLQDNHFIHTGYRVKYSTHEIWRSLFTWHNETGNIWTHGVGSVVLTLVALCFHAERAFSLTAEDHLVFLGFFSGAFICLATSTLYHSSHCHSKDAYVLFGCLDYAGISTMICGSSTIATYYLFYCDFWSRSVWMGLTCASSAVGIIGPWYQHWTHPSFHTQRALIYVSSGVFSGLPVLHYIAANGLPGVGASFYFYFTLVCHVGGVV